MPSCSVVIIVRIVADIDPLPAIGGQNVPHAAAIAKAVAKSSAHEKPVAEVRAVQREVGDSGRSNDAGTYNAAVDTDEASVDADEASVNADASHAYTPNAPHADTAHTHAHAAPTHTHAHATPAHAASAAHAAAAAAGSG